MARSDPASNGIAVTPSDATVLDPPARALYVGVSGDVRVRTTGNDNLTFKNVPVGFFPVSVEKVFDTGTDAEEIIALW